MSTSQSVHDESVPLLVGKPPKKPFRRARPLWLVPFAVIASLVGTMTSAPRLEVFTQLSCNHLYGHHGWNDTQSTSSSPSNPPYVTFYPSLDSLGPHFSPYTPFSEGGAVFIPDPLNSQSEVNLGTGSKGDNSNSDDTEDPRTIPSARCLSDPAVQAGTARLQTIMTTIMGLLTALTTGWWGHFSERHGRTSVLALSTLGFFLGNLVFILVSTPSSPLSKHGHILLFVSPIIQGLLGGFSTLQSVTSAYLSDCTSSGSRAQLFSRFGGAVALGSCVGPALGGWLIRHPIPWLGDSPIPGRQSVTSVFWVAVLFSFINFLLVAFVFPESLDKEKREKAMIAYLKIGAVPKKDKARDRALTLSTGDLGDSSTDDEDNIEGNQPRQEERESGVRSGFAGIISRFLSPLAVFLPVVVLDPSGIGRKRRDWSLTLLAVGVFVYMLSVAVSQFINLYAEHTYGWGPDQLSYYISFMGGGRGVFLLILLPMLISFLKPKSLPPNENNGKGKPPTLTNSSKSSNSNISTSSAMVHQPPLQKSKKPKPTRSQLGREISFDLLLTRFSLMIEILSHILIILFPTPTLKVNNFKNFARSQAMFVVASSLSSMGSGAVSAIHSLALCMLQVRALDNAAATVDGDLNVVGEEGNGALFGAFAVLESIGQMIIGPVIFGLVYSGTVAKFPKAIFTLAAGFLMCVLMIILCVRNPVRPAHPGQSKRRKNREGRDVERGRSRVNKDLRGGAIVNYGSDGSHDTSRHSS